MILKSKRTKPLGFTERWAQLVLQKQAPRAKRPQRYGAFSSEALAPISFYMGSWGWGIVYLLTCWLYIPFIAALVEWVRIVLMSDDEFYAKLAEFQSKEPGPFGFFW